MGTVWRTIDCSGDGRNVRASSAKKTALWSFHTMRTQKFRSANALGLQRQKKCIAIVGSSGASK
jgi:hypothetical protein